jgi:hypothetical protein
MARLNLKKGKSLALLMNSIEIAAITQQSIRSREESEGRRVAGGSTKGAIRSATMQTIQRNAATIQTDLVICRLDDELKLKVSFSVDARSHTRNAGEGCKTSQRISVAMS